MTMSDYVYGGAYLRTLENAIIGTERLSRLLEAKGLSEAYSLLEEFGCPVIRDPETGIPMREATLTARLRGALGEVLRLAPESPVLRMWLYPYDCNNLKATIKGAARGINVEGMLFDFGTVPAATLAGAVRERSFSAFPPFMRAAAEVAMDTYAATKDPQQIDLILDRACFRDMTAAAEMGSDYVRGLLTLQIDLLNIVIALRVLRMGGGVAAAALLGAAQIPGGQLRLPDAEALLAGGEAYLWLSLRVTPYARYAEAVEAAGGALQVAERLAEDMRMERIREAAYLPMGEDTMVAFLLAHEYEVRNLRILFSGLEAGLDRERLGERIRCSYV